ncbi:PREDICTED: uncharacterized protein LOC108781007 [Cyphomyrmex costatus]|nr:PREDICTED: uncharacterized protein LOC108781007 [Cyphomyrmex costatus]
MLRIIAKRIQGVTITSLRTFGTQTASTNSSNVNTNVPGLSNNVVKIPNTPVGPNASKNKEYKNPEYFCYHVDSFGEAEVELAKYRLPAPSNRTPFNK